MRVSRRVYLLAPQVDRDGHNWQMVAKPPAGSKGKNLYKTSGTRDRAEAEIRARRWEELLNGLAAPLPPRATVAALLSKYLAVREVDGTPTGTVITYRTAMKRIAAEVAARLVGREEAWWTIERTRTPQGRVAAWLVPGWTRRTRGLAIKAAERDLVAQWDELRADHRAVKVLVRRAP